MEKNDIRYCFIFGKYRLRKFGTPVEICDTTSLNTCEEEVAALLGNRGEVHNLCTEWKGVRRKTVAFVWF